MKDNQRVAVTKRMLQEGLLRLLAEKSVDKIKVTELCAEAGINRATFYRHYELPRDILEELRRDTLLEIRDIVLALAPSSPPPKTLEAICQYCYDKGPQLRVLFEHGEGEGFSHLLYDFYFEQRDLYGGGDSPLDDGLIKLASYYYAGGIYYILRQWLTEEIEKTPKEVADLIYGLITAGKIAPAAPGQIPSAR